MQRQHNTTRITTTTTTTATTTPVEILDCGEELSLELGGVQEGGVVAGGRSPGIIINGNGEVGIFVGSVDIEENYIKKN